MTASETLVYVYDGYGKLAAEYSSIYYSTTRTSYLTTDNLGSPRVITDQLGNVTARRDFLPFGEELYAGVGARSTSLKYSTSDTDFVRQRFTGYEKDGETLLDFAEARMYESRHGRFTAADPLLSSASVSNPQTFNRYIYTGNNPINYTDPLGLKYYEEKSTGNIYWSDTPMDSKLYNDLTGQIRLVTQPGDNFRNQGVSDGSLVRFNESRQVSVVGQREIAQLAETTGTNVQATYDEVISTDATISDHIISAFMTWGENNGGSLAYAAGVQPFNQHTETGQFIGNVASTAQGLAQIAGGGATAGAAGTLTGILSPLCATGIGCLIPATTGTITAAGLVEMAHGGAVIGNTYYNMQMNQGPSSRSGGTSSTGQWSRDPQTLQDEMALEAAKNGAGTKIIDNLNDARYKGMEKWEYKVKSNEGRDSVVHYVRDPKTGNLMDFKFKKHSNGAIP